MILLAYSYPSGLGTVQGNVSIDATVSEGHDLSVDVTDHQVERGSNVVDHTRPLPRRLRIEGLVSNTPLGLSVFSVGMQKRFDLTHTRGASERYGKQQFQDPKGNVIEFSAVSFDGEMDRARDVFGDLIPAAQNGALFTVTTFFETYEDMVISGFSVQRDASAGNDLRCSIEFKQVRFVDAQEVPGLPPKQKIEKKPDHKGQKPAQEVTESDNRTGLARGADAKDEIVNRVLNFFSGGFGPGK